MQRIGALFIPPSELLRMYGSFARCDERRGLCPSTPQTFDMDANRSPNARPAMKKDADFRISVLFVIHNGVWGLVPSGVWGAAPFEIIAERYRFQRSRMRISPVERHCSEPSLYRTSSRRSSSTASAVAWRSMPFSFTVIGLPSTQSRSR